MFVLFNQIRHIARTRNLAFAAIFLENRDFDRSYCLSYFYLKSKELVSLCIFKRGFLNFAKYLPYRVLKLFSSVVINILETSNS